MQKPEPTAGGNAIGIFTLSKDGRRSNCNVEDTTDHVINTCALHDKDRNDLISDLRHTGPVSVLLNSKKKSTAESLAIFLTKIEQLRIARNDEENQELIVSK